MFQRKPRRFRSNYRDRNQASRGGSISQDRQRLNSFNNGQSRNKFRPSLSAEKLLEKYSALAKEAITSGDKTLGENYLQHADHYMRIVEEKNKNRIENKVSVVDKTFENNKLQSENLNTKQEQETKIEQAPKIKE